MDIFEIISDSRSDPFTLIYLDLPGNSYMIECTNTQSFEGENCASTISVEHTLGSDMNLFGYDMILFLSNMTLFGSGCKFQELSLKLVVSLINFGVKNKVQQVSFKIVVGDLVSLHSFGSDLFSDLIIYGSGFKIQELPVLFVTGFISFGVKNQAPQVSFNFAAEDSMLVFSYEIVDIIFWKYLDIFERISYLRSDPFTLFYLELPIKYHMIACTNIQNFVENGENCASTISVEHTLGSDMNLFGSDMILFGSDLILLSSRFQFHHLLVFL